MKFSLWTDYGALNSTPIFTAFANSLMDRGFDVVYNDPSADVNVIWSVLFNGRMARNKEVWEQKKPTIVLEIGGIKRGITWKVGFNGINRDGNLGPKGNDNSRAKLLGLELQPWRANSDKAEYIVLCGQHDKSLQWQGMPPLGKWVSDTMKAIRKVTPRPIVWRAHPRAPLQYLETQYKDVIKEPPVKLQGTYDSYDQRFDALDWAVISYSSNMGPHAVIRGKPAFVGESSLAWDVGNDINNLENIENPIMPDREQWLNDYAWTEYTIEEISEGLPLNYLTTLL